MYEKWEPLLYYVADEGGGVVGGGVGLVEAHDEPARGSGVGVLPNQR